PRRRARRRAWCAPQQGASRRCRRRRPRLPPGRRATRPHPCRCPRRATVPPATAPASPRGHRGSARTGARHGRSPRRPTSAPPQRPAREARSAALLFQSPRGEAVPPVPQRREELLLDQPAEQLDRRALRADHLVADDSRDHLVMAHPPQRQALVPIDQGLGELVQVFVLATLDVEVENRQSALAQRARERLPEQRRDAADLTEAGRVEAAAVPEPSTDGLVLPRRHLLEHVELSRDVLEAERRAAQETLRSAEIAAFEQPRRLLDLVPGELEPELR